MNISSLIVEAEDRTNYKRPWLKHYNRETPANLTYPDKTIYEMLQARVEKDPGNMAPWNSWERRPGSKRSWRRWTTAPGHSRKLV